MFACRATLCPEWHADALNNHTSLRLLGDYHHIIHLMLKDKHMAGTSLDPFTRVFDFFKQCPKKADMLSYTLDFLENLFRVLLSENYQAIL